MRSNEEKNLEKQMRKFYKELAFALGHAKKGKDNKISIEVGFADLTKELLNIPQDDPRYGQLESFREDYQEICEKWNLHLPAMQKRWDIFSHTPTQEELDARKNQLRLNLTDEMNLKGEITYKKALEIAWGNKVEDEGATAFQYQSILVDQSLLNRRLNNHINQQWLSALERFADLEETFNFLQFVMKYGDFSQHPALLQQFKKLEKLYDDYYSHISTVELYNAHDVKAIIEEKQFTYQMLQLIRALPDTVAFISSELLNNVRGKELEFKDEHDKICAKYKPIIQSGQTISLTQTEKKIYNQHEEYVTVVSAYEKHIGHRAAFASGISSEGHKISARKLPNDMQLKEVKQEHECRLLPKYIDEAEYFSALIGYFNHSVKNFPSRFKADKNLQEIIESILQKIKLITCSTASDAAKLHQLLNLFCQERIRFPAHSDLVQNQLFNRLLLGVIEYPLESDYKNIRCMAQKVILLNNLKANLESLDLERLGKKTLKTSLGDLLNSIKMCLGFGCQAECLQDVHNAINTCLTENWSQTKRRFSIFAPSSAAALKQLKNYLEKTVNPQLQQYLPLPSTQSELSASLK